MLDAATVSEQKSPVINGPPKCCLFFVLFNVVMVPYVVLDGLLLEGVAGVKPSIEIKSLYF